MRLSIFDDLIGEGFLTEDQLLECHLGHLTPKGIKPGDEHDARRIVDDHIHPGGKLQGPDIPALFTDHSCLHLVTGKMHNRNGYIGRVVGCIPFDGQYDEALAIFRRMTGHPQIEVFIDAAIDVGKIELKPIQCR